MTGEPLGLFDSVDVPEPDLSAERVDALLAEVKRNSRNRRLVLLAPMALAAAVVAALMAAPPRHGGLSLLPDADASASELPRVFGTNGVWRLAEPITEAPVELAAPIAVNAPTDEPAAPSYRLAPPSAEDLESLPASASTPPTPTLGQTQVFDAEIAEANAVDDVAEPEAGSIFAAPLAADAAQPDAAPAPDSSLLSPGSAAHADEPATPPPSSPGDDDVSVADPSQPEPSGLASDTPDADVTDPIEVHPSTPLADPSDPDVSTEAPATASAAATIVTRSVLVHSAHVSVTVSVIDVDSSVVDWCNTRVDWGDGSVTRASDSDGTATCAAPCEHQAGPSELGIETEITFTHEYATVIDAAPRIFVATGDGCSYDLAELRLNPFTVVPY